MDRKNTVMLHLSFFQPTAQEQFDSNPILLDSIKSQKSKAVAKSQPDTFYNFERHHNIQLTVKLFFCQEVLEAGHIGIWKARIPVPEGKKKKKQQLVITFRNNRLRIHRTRADMHNLIFSKGY